MRFNSYSYIPQDQATILQELKELGFDIRPTDTPKNILKTFLARYHFTYPNPMDFYKRLLASWDQDLASFFEDEDAPLTADTLYMVAFQLLGFVPFVDFDNLEKFRNDSHFPINFETRSWTEDPSLLIENLYQLLNLRRKDGNTLIDSLVAQGLIPVDNHYHSFNGKTLATFSTHDLIRQAVYVETPFDSDKDGLKDIIKVNVIRPRTAQSVPVMMTASPYNEGTNGKASDKSLQHMNTELAVKPTSRIAVVDPSLDEMLAKSEPETRPTEASSQTTPQTEQVGYIPTYTLNDYFLSRGFASIYVSGLGTRDSEGMMPDGSYQQVLAFKAVIDWLNGRATAYTDHTRQTTITADWTNGKVVTTGLSYLGTMSNGLATTGVDGLEVVIAEAGISSWYDYYRENGLVTSPGGYPGEDFDSLDEFTYSRALRGAEHLRHHVQHQAAVAKLRKDLDRESGDYNQFWHDRNYLPHAKNVKAHVIFTHGTQDWNVKPKNVYQMFHALPSSIEKTLFLHHGAHVYMNNWQSIDFRESINALLTRKLLGLDNGYSLPTVVWQDNRHAQAFQELSTFGGTKKRRLRLGAEEISISNHYPSDLFAKYSKNYQEFLKALHSDFRNTDGVATSGVEALAIDVLLQDDLWVNGAARLTIRVKSSVAKGLLSVQVLDKGKRKRHTPYPSVLAPRSMDNGRFFQFDNLTELPFVEGETRLVTKGYMNLQNRTDLLTIEAVKPDEWMDVTFELQPTIYRMKAGETLRVLLYTTDFEVTVRDNSDYQLTVDLSQSYLDIPVTDEGE